MRESHSVVVVAFDDFQLLDLAGPVEVFETANRLGREPRYRRTLVTPNGRSVRSSSGVEVGADASITELTVATAAIGTLVVVGGVGARGCAQDAAFLASVVALGARARRITSVCTGALVLAAAGLLDGYRATTHWASCDELAAAHPTVEVLSDRIYVHERDRWTSAGVTAGIDLALALIEDDHGAELAHQVAGWLVVFTRRPGGQAQFSAQLRAEPAHTPAIREVQLWLPDHLTEALTVARLAARANMSERSFARAFRAETGTTPAAHIEDLRVEAARRLLEGTDLTVAAVATRVGLKHPETLHRAVARRLGTTPDRYRQHFTWRAS
ncbi:MAG: DJ-1/PfpI family protein [Actinomycetota bacterium]|nr:DJ-1/PfpI family protein [Actinomycetota bacterium]